MNSINKKKNLLLVCTDISDFDKINELNLSNYSKVILASDDLRVHKKCKNLNIIDEVIFLQKPFSFTKVADSVVEMIDRVNIYFDNVVELDIFSKKDLFWTYHVEGGHGQIIQDTLIAIECFNLIFDEHEITEIATISNNNTLQIKILKKVALEKGYKINFYNQKYFIDRKKIKNFMRPIYYFLKSLKNKITSKKFTLSNKSHVVLFQVCGSTKNNIRHSLLAQNELLKSGFTSLNIIWGNTKEVKKLNDEGHSAIAIEYYLKYSDIFYSLYKGLLIFIKVKLLRNSFYKTTSFNYKGIDIRDILFANIFEFIYTNGPENYRFRIAAQRFVSEYSKAINAVMYCAAKFLHQGTILSEIMDDKYLKFEYNIGLGILSPYIKHNSKKNYNFLSNKFIRFVPNEIEKEYLIENMNLSERSIFKFGPGRFNSHFENLKFFTKKHSMKEIGIKNNYEIYVLIPFSSPITGYISAEEVIFTLDILVEFAKSHPNIAFIFKPNYSINISYFSKIFQNKTDNVFFVDQKALPDHALNIADVIITKFSTMGMEAMIYDTQVVSILLDDEKNFKVYGDAAEYIYKKKQLNHFLETKLSSKENFFHWKNSFNEKRKIFVQKYYLKLEKSSAKIIAETVTKHIHI